MPSGQELGVSNVRPYRGTPFYLWELFLTYCRVWRHCGCEAAINHPVPLPISTPLSIPDLDSHRIHAFKAPWVNFTQYKQELLVMHRPEKVSPKATSLGMLLESGKEEGRELALWICVTHFYKFLQENCLSIAKRGIKHSSESLTKGQMLMQICGKCSL